MSKATAQTFPVVHYTRLSDLFQEVQRETPPLSALSVHIDPLLLKLEGWRVWGILLTALPAVTIHAGWVPVDAASSIMLHEKREEGANAKQNRLYMRLVAYAQRQGFTVYPGAYVVPADTFRIAAGLPAGLPAWSGEEDRS